MDYKCYLEDENGESGCVFDKDYDGDIQDCIIAPTVSCQEACVYWMPAKEDWEIKEIEDSRKQRAITKQEIMSDALELRGGHVGPHEMRVSRKYGKI